MNKHLRYVIAAGLVSGITAGIITLSSNVENSKEHLSRILKEHPFSDPRRQYTEEDGRKGKPAAPDRAWEQDFLRTMDPALGRPTPERLPATIQAMKSMKNMQLAPGSASAPWVERGPNNVGGRTRALVWDPNDITLKKVWAGGVTGGLWFNNDITNSNSSWNAVNDLWDNIAISSIAFDPNNSQIMYVGTGEGYGSSSSRGAGIWKSTNGGTSWTQLTSTTGFYYVNDIVVRNESGTSVVYAAVDALSYKGQFHGTSSAGIQRSTNGGTSWTNVSPDVPSQSIKMVASDLEISANGRLWAGSRTSPFSASDRGGGRIFYSDNGTTWTISNSTPVNNGEGRVEVACAPSNANVVYAIIESGGQVLLMKKTTNAGSVWNNMTEPADADQGIPDTDFSRGQAWYDLILAVDPVNENNVIAGGIDLFRSTNAGNTWGQISKWSNNNDLALLNCSEVHADQHAIVFKPGSSSTLLIGNDGGVYYTTSISTAETNDVIFSRNKGYNVTQYYSAAIHPTSGSNIMLAGAQDNGTQLYNSVGVNSTTEVSGGDGGYCFIDQTNGNYAIASYVYNNYYLSTNSGTSFNITLADDDNTGKFINPADYDDNNDVLYSGRSSISILRIRNVTGTPSAGETVNITGMSSEASHIRVSPYSSTVYVGTDVGDIFKVTDPSGTPSTTNITGTLPAGSVSCIEFGANENEILVTYFNYGVTSVWYTSNGGTNWVSKEGNLPDMPVRWALFNLSNRSEVILATELGVWATSNFNTTTPTWTASNNGLANVRVDMLQIRSSDKMVMAATHGRGVFTSAAFNLANPPKALFSVNRVLGCQTDTIQFTDTSDVAATSFQWTISPATFNFTGGTSATSQNPKVLFTADGVYNIKLKVTNSAGSDSLTKNAYVRIGGLGLPYTENWENPSTYGYWLLENPDAQTTWTIYDIGGNGSSVKAAGIDNFNYSDAGTAIIRDGLISPPISLNGFTNISLGFKHAYRRYSTTNQDSMAVYVSTNCGSTWTRVSSFRETQGSSPFNFITNSNLATGFVPSTSADWCGNTGYSTCKSIDLTAYAGSTIRIKFENISGYGNNLFIDDISVTGTASVPAPVADFSASSTSTCNGNNVTFTDLTTNSPTSWSWSFTPNTVSYSGGTSSTSQHPIVQFTAAGSYTVALTATNPNTSNTKTKTAYINVGSTVIPTAVISSNDTNICSGSNAAFTISISNGGSSPSYQWRVNNSNVSTASTFSSSTLSDNDSVYCTVTSNAACASPALVISNKIKMNVNPLPVVPAITQAGNTLTCSVTENAYQWYQDITAISGANSKTFNIAANGNYAVEVTNTEGCKSKSSLFNAVFTGLVLPEFMHSFVLYPNPSSDKVYIDFETTAKQLTISVYDVAGKKISGDLIQCLPGKNTYQVKTDLLSRGTYLLQLSDGEATLKRNFIIK